MTNSPHQIISKINPFITLADFFDNHFYPDAKIRKKHPKHDFYTFNKHIRPVLGDTPITDLSNFALDAWVRHHIKNDYAPVTINKHIFFINRMMNMARHWGVLDHSSFENRVIKKMPTGDFKQRFLNEHEIKKLLVACKADSNPHIYFVARLLLSTGARVGEALVAKWEHIDNKKMVWSVPVAKGGRSRSVCLGTASMAVFSEIKMKNDDLLIPTGPRD